MGLLNPSQTPPHNPDVLVDGGVASQTSFLTPSFSRKRPRTLDNYRGTGSAKRARAMESSWFDAMLTPVKSIMRPLFGGRTDPEEDELSEEEDSEMETSMDDLPDTSPRGNSWGSGPLPSGGTADPPPHSSRAAALSPATPSSLSTPADPLPFRPRATPTAPRPTDRIQGNGFRTPAPRPTSTPLRLSSTRTPLADSSRGGIRPSPAPSQLLSVLHREQQRALFDRRLDMEMTPIGKAGGYRRPQTANGSLYNSTATDSTVSTPLRFTGTVNSQYLDVNSASTDRAPRSAPAYTSMPPRAPSLYQERDSFDRPIAKKHYDYLFDADSVVENSSMWEGLEEGDEWDRWDEESPLDEDIANISSIPMRKTGESDLDVKGGSSSITSSSSSSSSSSGAPPPAPPMRVPEGAAKMAQAAADEEEAMMRAVIETDLHRQEHAQKREDRMREMQRLQEQKLLSKGKSIEELRKESARRKEERETKLQRIVCCRRRIRVLLNNTILHLNTQYLYIDR